MDVGLTPTVFSLKLFLPPCSGLLRQLLVLAGGQASVGDLAVGRGGDSAVPISLAAAVFRGEIRGRQAL